MLLPFVPSREAEPTKMPKSAPEGSATTATSPPAAPSSRGAAEGGDEAAETEAHRSGAPDRRPRRERADNAARRRGQLVDATLRSIVRNGLQGTTLATVAREAGLSQGVAVFYFQSKDALLAAAFRHHYEVYEQTWRLALGAAPDDPAARLAALVRADFDPRVCAPEAQVIWHAFWGEAGARHAFAEIAESYDGTRRAIFAQTCAALLAELGRDTAEAPQLAAGIEALTDGLWLALYLDPSAPDTAEARAVARRFLSALFPERAAAFDALAEA